MSLNPEQRELLNKTILRLVKIVQDLEQLPCDPRALDLIEVAASLIEQQIDMDIIFEALEDEDAEDVILFDEDDEELTEVVHIKFDNTEDKDNYPSAEELQQWWDMEA